MADFYQNFAALAAHNKAGKDYRIDCKMRSSAMSHIAIHGGGIEPGTSELASVVSAQTGQSYYSFLGLKSSGNARLHITSNYFDEPVAVELQKSVIRTLSYHGMKGDSPLTLVGGLDEQLKNAVCIALEEAGFTAERAGHYLLSGEGLSNIAHRNKSGMGAQLELSYNLRASFFKGDDLSRLSRERGNYTDIFWRYVEVLVRVATQLPA